MSSPDIVEAVGYQHAVVQSCDPGRTGMMYSCRSVYGTLSWLWARAVGLYQWSAVGHLFVRNHRRTEQGDSGQQFPAWLVHSVLILHTAGWTCLGKPWTQKYSCLGEQEGAHHTVPGSIMHTSNPHSPACPEVFQSVPIEAHGGWILVVMLVLLSLLVTDCHA